MGGGLCWGGDGVQSRRRDLLLLERCIPFSIQTIVLQPRVFAFTVMHAIEDLSTKSFSTNEARAIVFCMMLRRNMVICRRDTVSPCFLSELEAPSNLCHTESSPYDRFAQAHPTSTHPFRRLLSPLSCSNPCRSHLPIFGSVRSA